MSLFIDRGGGGGGGLVGTQRMSHLDRVIKHEYSSKVSSHYDDQVPGVKFLVKDLHLLG